MENASEKAHGSTRSSQPSSSSTSTSSSSTSSSDSSKASPAIVPVVPRPWTLKPDSFDFCGSHFRFTPIKACGEQVGWEVNCKFRHVEESRTAACRQSLRFNTHGGAEDLEQKLKWWCLQAATAPTRKAHKLIPFPTDDDLPSLFELDLLAIEQADLFDHNVAKNQRF